MTWPSAAKNLASSQPHAPACALGRLAHCLPAHGDSRLLPLCAVVWRCRPVVYILGPAARVWGWAVTTHLIVPPASVPRAHTHPTSPHAPAPAHEHPLDRCAVKTLKFFSFQMREHFSSTLSPLCFVLFCCTFLCFTFWDASGLVASCFLHVRAVFEARPPLLT